MSTVEDRKAAWLARSPFSMPQRVDDVPGVQETRREPIAPPELYIRRTALDECLSGGSGQPDLVSGFAAKPWSPHEYQERGVEWLATRPAGALFLPPGMGKSSISLAAFLLVRKLLGRRARMLLLAPLTVCLTTWQTEPSKWLQFQGLRVGLAHGADKALVLNDPYYDIVVMNYDGIAWAAPLLAAGHQFDILLMDELTRVKHTTSQRFKKLKPILPSFKFRWGLTGTPAANGYMDLFGQVFTLDLGARLGKFITHFRLTYFYQNAWEQYKYHITKEKAAKLTAKLEDLAMYMDPKDWLKLPPLIDIILPVELEPAEFKQYVVLENDFILKFSDASVVTAVNAGVLTNKLRQFTGGAVYLEGGATWTLTSKAKLQRLESLVEELAGEPLMVAYQFNHELERLLEAFPNAQYIKGGMTEKALTATVEAWNGGEVPILFVQPQAAAHGINLQFGGSAMCWFSLTYNLEEYSQLIARLYRQGQTKTVRNYILTATKTIDEVLAKTLAEKGVVQDRVFQALKLYAASR